jgi:hypothetical protein
MRCLGRNSNSHCCYIDGKVCEFLEENSEPGFRWSCGLRRELGSWNAVLSDPRYKPIGEKLSKHGINCKDWPGPKDICTVCGKNTHLMDNPSVLSTD